ncbi:MAG: hypothetical protein F4Z03_10765 [Gemmatimonadetes bacterium]|nr:hypothetical protein [Gemmatimonadota bacterium]MYH19768.1 hypothetical protein [Gemmatimonadota bacterium]
MQLVVYDAVYDFLAIVGQVNTRVLQLVGHQQPVGVVYPRAPGSFQGLAPRLGVRDFHAVDERLPFPRVQIHQDHVGLAAFPVGPGKAVPAVVLVPVVGAEPEEREPDVPGGVPVIPASHGLHHLFRDDLGLIAARVRGFRLRFRTGAAGNPGY